MPGGLAPPSHLYTALIRKGGLGGSPPIPVPHVRPDPDPHRRRLEGGPEQRTVVSCDRGHDAAADPVDLIGVHGADLAQGAR
jgi:hypothetical protein